MDVESIATDDGLTFLCITERLLMWFSHVHCGHFCICAISLRSRSARTSREQYIPRYKVWFVSYLGLLYILKKKHCSWGVVVRTFSLETLAY